MMLSLHKRGKKTDIEKLPEAVNKFMAITGVYNTEKFEALAEALKKEQKDGKLNMVIKAFGVDEFSFDDKIRELGWIIWDIKRKDLMKIIESCTGEQPIFRDDIHFEQL